MTLCVTLVDKQGKEKSRWISVSGSALDEFFRYRIGEDKELAMALFPTLDKEDLEFILNHRKEKLNDNN